MTNPIIKQIETHLRSIAFESAGVKMAGAMPAVLITSKQMPITTIGGVRLMSSLHMAPKLIMMDTRGKAKKRVVIVGRGYVEQFMLKLFSQLETY